MATTKKPAAAAKPAAAKAPAKPKKKDTFVIDYDSFTATNDWPLYTVSTYVRAKQLESNEVVEGSSAKAGQYVVVGEDHKVQIVDAAKFESEYEIVKGPHKREF